jgi:hypothetical protein
MKHHVMTAYWRNGKVAPLHAAYQDYLWVINNTSWLLLAITYETERAAQQIWMLPR